MESESPGGTLLVLEPKSLRSFTTNDEYLYAMKEDLADWFSCLYKLPVDAETFLSVLETGVILCKHANEVQHFFKERRLMQSSNGNNPLAMRSYFIRSVPEGTVTCRSDVKPGTFQARDNVSNFISWCRSLGIPDVLRFETDDLVMRKNEKSVILCLLELARVGAKLGMLAPTLVQMEEEIDQEIESGEPPPQIKTCDMKSLDELVRELVGQCSCPVQFPLVKVGEGKYQIGDSKTLIFVRVLRNHVMVRVGGGWDTLENYLNKHDPCRCHYKGHRAGGSAATRHQIMRRSSTSALIATRTPQGSHPVPPVTPNNNTSVQPTSPRRMSSAISHSPSQGFVKGSSPGPAAGLSRGASPARSVSPTPFGKGPSPLRSESPTPGSNGVRRLPNNATSHSVSESSIGRLTPARCASPATGSQSLRQSYEQQRLQQQQQQQQQHPPQHQAVQRVKSPSPSPSPVSSRCVSPAVSGNRTIPRPISRGASGIPRPQSPALSTSTPGSKRQLFSNMPRSVSFDAPTRTDAEDEVDTMTEHQMTNTQQQDEGGGDNFPSIDQISTMTLSEFKKLISSNLTVPPPSSDGSGDGSSSVEEGNRASQQGMRRSNSADAPGRNLSWSTVRDKAKSVCNTLASSASSRRASNTSSTASIIARRNLPQTPASPNLDSRSKTHSSVERSKTPSAIDSPPNPSAIGGFERPKTPLFKPKKPIMSAYAYRPKTPSAETNGAPEAGSHDSRPQSPQRPKTPTSIGLYNKGPNAAASNCRPYGSDSVRASSTDSSNDTNVPKTPTSFGGVSRYLNNGSANAETVNNPRVSTTTIVSKADEPLPLMESERVKTTSFVYSEPSEDVRSVTSDTSKASGSKLGNDITDNDDTSSVSLSLPLSRRSQSPADYLDDSSEIADAMNEDGTSRSVSYVAAPLRDRPSTPSRIPKPSFIPRPNTPAESANTANRTENKPRILPRPSTPNGLSGEKELSVGSSSNDKPVNNNTSSKPPVTPRKVTSSSLVPRCATPSAYTTSRSYAEIYNQRRAQTPGPESSSSSSASSNVRSTTPGLDKGNSGGRRESLSRSMDVGQLRKARSVTNLLQESGRMSAVEVSDSGTSSSSGSTNAMRRGNCGTALRSMSTESQGRLQRQDDYDTNVGEGEVLIVSRNMQGHHSVQVTDRNRNLAYDSGDRERSKTPGPGVGTGGVISRYQQQPRGIIRKPSNNTATQNKPGTGARGVSKALNRTEAWVDSTLNDPKRKQQPPRPGRRAMTPNSLSLPDSELMSRPLEEIQAILPLNCDTILSPDPDSIETLPEDPEMYRKMEQLFEKYREMELRASVCDTPGGDGRHGSSYNSSRSSGGGGPSRSSSSLRTGPSVPYSGSYTSGLSSRGGDISDNGSSSYRGSRGPSVESDRFSKESSPAAAAASSSSSVSGVNHYYNGAASNHGITDNHPDDPDDACVSVTTPDPQQQQQQGAPAVSAEDIVDDMDAVTLKENPTALVSKIKQILAVRPRNEDAGTVSKASGIRSRIPAPAAALAKSRQRSKSASNLFNGDSLSIYDPNSFSPNGTLDFTRDESTCSDVSSDFNSRCETPVPKVAQPLTTGRSTLFKRELSGRSLSQDDRVSSSSSLSSSSHRRHWEEEGEYV